MRLERLRPLYEARLPALAVTQEMRADLIRLARENNMSLSEIVRQAVVFFLRSGAVNAREESAETLHFEAMCLERQAAVELPLADTAVDEESVAFHLENRQLCQDMAGQARAKAARIMAEAVQDMWGVCPSCRAATAFSYCGEQHFPAHVAARVGTPASFRLWTCHHCLSTSSEMAIEKAGEPCQ